MNIAYASVYRYLPSRLGGWKQPLTARPFAWWNRLGSQVGEQPMKIGIGSPEPLEVIERRVLEQALRNVTGYISVLPDASEWKWTFFRVRQQLVAQLGEPPSAQSHRLRAGKV